MMFFSEDLKNVFSYLMGLSLKRVYTPPAFATDKPVVYDSIINFLC